jgi:hypothetical protein
MTEEKEFKKEFYSVLKWFPGLTLAQKREVFEKTVLLIESVEKRNSKPAGQMFFDLFKSREVFDFVVDHLIQNKFVKDITNRKPFVDPSAEYWKSLGYELIEEYIVRQLKWEYEPQELAEAIKDLQILGYFKPTIKLTDKKIEWVIFASFYPLKIKFNAIKKTRTNDEIKMSPSLGVPTYKDYKKSLSNVNLF